MKTLSSLGQPDLNSLKNMINRVGAESISIFAISETQFIAITWCKASDSIIVNRDLLNSEIKELSDILNKKVSW